MHVGPDRPCAHCPASPASVTMLRTAAQRGAAIAIHRAPASPQRTAGDRGRPRRRGEPRRLWGPATPSPPAVTAQPGSAHPRRARRIVGRLASHAGPELRRGPADGPPGGRRHRSLRLDPRRCDGRAGGEPARRDRHARRHRLRGRDDRRAQRLLRRVVGRGQGSHPVRRHRQPRHPHRRWRADAGVHGQRGHPGRTAPGSRTTSGRGTSSSSTGTAVSSPVSAAAAPTRRRGSGTTSPRATPCARSRCSTSRGSAAASTGTIAAVRTAVGRAVRGRRRPRARRPRSRLRAFRPAGPRRHGRRGARHRGDRRRHRRGRARGVQGSAAELAGQDRRHLRGAGAHAPRRLVVVALRRRDGSTHDEASGTCH